MRGWTAVGALAVAATAAAAAPAAQPDPQFGRNGLVVERLTNGSDIARAVLPLKDGSLVVAAESGGRRRAFHGPDAVLLKIRRNGSLDPSFGRRGVLRVSVGRGDDRVSGVARLADGKLVAGGAAANLNADPFGNDVSLYAFRALPSGRLDATFGRRGLASVRVPTGTFITALAGVAAEPDGGVVVGGTTEKRRLTLVRFDARGRLDLRFGNRGIAFHRVQFPWALTRQPDGRLLVVGMTDLPARDWFVLRLRPDGARDRTFGGGDGLVVTTFGATPDSAHAVAVDPRGRILVAGYTAIANTNCTSECDRLRLVRYLSDGRVDRSFGRDGRVEPEIGLANDELGLALQPNGGILVAGSSFALPDADPQLAIWRFRPNGALDRTFGSGGMLAVNPRSAWVNLDVLTNVAVRPDGRIVAGGGAAKPTTFNDLILWDVAVLQAR